MACGKPIIASALGETKRIIEEANCGLCSDPNNPKELAEKLIELKAMKKERLSVLGNNGLKYCHKNFNKANLLDIMDIWIKDEIKENNYV